MLLLIIFILLWLSLALRPWNREDWIAENILTVFFIGLLIFTYRAFRFSNTSYTLLFLFMVLHAVGAHYTYNQMPLFTALKEGFLLSRNHYDRIVHFLFGALFFLPTYELLRGKVKNKLWLLALTFLALTALKSAYEVLEYGYVLVWESQVITENFLGMQGDSWDAQKDIALGMLGAALAGITLLFKRK